MGAISGEGDEIGGDAAEVGLELLRLRSNRVSSPRLVRPVAKIFFPFLPGTGVAQARGPEVNWTGSVDRLPNKPGRSSNAHSCPAERK